MVNLTLPKWLQATFDLNKRWQKTDAHFLKEEIVDPFSTQEQDLSQATPSLSYLGFAEKVSPKFMPLLTKNFLTNQ